MSAEQAYRERARVHRNIGYGSRLPSRGTPQRADREYALRRLAVAVDQRAVEPGLDAEARGASRRKPVSHQRVNDWNIRVGVLEGRADAADDRVEALLLLAAFSIPQLDEEPVLRRFAGAHATGEEREALLTRPAIDDRQRILRRAMAEHIPIWADRLREARAIFGTELLPDRRRV